jgi:hypothetical protein
MRKVKLETTEQTTVRGARPFSNSLYVLTLSTKVVSQIYKSMNE